MIRFLKRLRSNKFKKYFPKNRLQSLLKYQGHNRSPHYLQDFRSVFSEQEVPDPYFGGDEGFDYVLDILEDSVSGFLESIS